MKFHTRALEALNAANIEARIDNDNQVIITTPDTECVLYASTKYWGRKIDENVRFGSNPKSKATRDAISNYEELVPVIDTLTDKLGLVLEPNITIEDGSPCLVSKSATVANNTYILRRKARVTVTDKSRTNTTFQGYEVPIMKESKITKTEHVMYFRGLDGTETGLEVLKLTKYAATPVQASKIIDDPRVFPEVKSLLHILFGRDARVSTEYVAAGRDVWHVQLVELADDSMETLSSTVSIPGEHLGGVAIFSIRPMRQENTHGKWWSHKHEASDVPSNVVRIARSRLNLDCEYYWSDTVWYAISPEGTGIVISVDSVCNDVNKDILDRANATMDLALRDAINYVGVSEQYLSVFKDLAGEQIKEETKMEFELTDMKRVYGGFKDPTKRLILTKCVATPEQAKAMRSKVYGVTESRTLLHILFGPNFSIQNGYVSTGDEVWYIDTVYDTAYSRERVTDTVHINIPFMVKDTAIIVQLSPVANFKPEETKHEQFTTGDQDEIIKFVEHRLGDVCKCYQISGNEIVFVNASDVAVKMVIVKRCKVTSLDNRYELRLIAARAQESLRAHGAIPVDYLTRFQYLSSPTFGEAYGSHKFSNDHPTPRYRTQSTGRPSRDVEVISLPLATVETFISDRSIARDHIRDVMRSHDVSNRIIEAHGLFVVTGFRENRRGCAIEIKTGGGEFVVYVCNTDLYNDKFEAQLQFATEQGVTITDLDLSLLTDDLIII